MKSETFQRLVEQLLVEEKERSGVEFVCANGAVIHVDFDDGTAFELLVRGPEDGVSGTLDDMEELLDDLNKCASIREQHMLVALLAVERLVQDKSLEDLRGRVKQIIECWRNPPQFGTGALPPDGK